MWSNICEHGSFLWTWCILVNMVHSCEHGAFLWTWFILVNMVHSCEQGADLFPLLNLPFETLFLNIFAPQICYLLSEVYSRPSILLISKVSSAIDINSLHSVSSDLDLRTYNGLSSLPCLSCIALFAQNNLILHGWNTLHVFIWRRNGR